MTNTRENKQEENKILLDEVKKISKLRVRTYEETKARIAKIKAGAF